MVRSYRLHGVEFKNLSQIFSTATSTSEREKSGSILEHKRLRGFRIHGRGPCPGEKPGDKCAFHGEGRYEPHVVPYTLEETIELWNYYLPVSSEKERVRQFLSSSEVKSDLRKREWSAVVTIDSEVANDGGSVISTDENGGNDACLARQESVGTQETVTESADSSVISISSDSQES
ncbi:hypothetical protein EIK77_009941 [Talaromyces pinophilus]|nr:hypothetical protein EIK77_009941 [Talaromyces pinophilus]